MRHVLLFLAVSLGPAVAQPSGDSAFETVHSIPFGSEANAIELSVVNRSVSDPVPGATVVVTAAPAWAAVTPAHVDVGALGPEAEGSAAFSFDAARSAPVGEPGEIAFEVRDGRGRVLERVAFRILVSAPAELALGAPYPNPSRDRAAVPFEVPEAGPVRVAVYDVLGREVAVVFDREAGPGAHEAAVGGLSAGTYLVRLVAGDEARVRRLTVVR